MRSDRKVCNMKNLFSKLNEMCIHPFWAAHFKLRTRVANLSLTQIEFWVINASIVFSRANEERQRDVNVSEMKPSDRMFMRCQFVFGSEELTGAEREMLGLYGAQLRDPFALLGSVPLGSVALWWGALDAVPMMGSGSCSLTWQSMNQLSAAQTRAPAMCAAWSQRWITWCSFKNYISIRVTVNFCIWRNIAKSHFERKMTCFIQIGCSFVLLA